MVNTYFQRILNDFWIQQILNTKNNLNFPTLQTKICSGQDFRPHLNPLEERSNCNTVFMIWHSISRRISGIDN